MARGGLSPTESRIYEDNAHLLVPNALQRLARQNAANAMLRPRLTKTYSAVPVTNGVIALGALANVLTDGLCWATFYDADDVDQVSPYVFKRAWQDLDRRLNPDFGYFAVRDNNLVTRQRGIENVAAGKVGTPGPVTIIAPFIPLNTLTDLPVELEADAVSVLAGLLPAHQIAAA